MLGFQPGEYYEPTKWQPYDVDDQYFAIREVENKQPHDDFDITNFELDDVEALWARVKGLGRGRGAPRADAVWHVQIRREGPRRLSLGVRARPREVKPTGFVLSRRRP